MMGRHVLDEYPIEKFIDDAMDLAASVYSFHDRFEIEQVDNEAHMIQTMLARICLLSEEVGEHARAVNRGQAVDAMLEVVDIMYIALGTLLVLGEDGHKAVATVIAKNEAKGPQGYAVRDGAGKVVTTQDTEPR